MTGNLFSNIPPIRQSNMKTGLLFGGQVNGRVYLHCDDYCGWWGRKVKGDLHSEVQQGFLTASWNGWVDAHGGEGIAALADVSVERLSCYIDSRQYETCPDSEERVSHRRQILDSLRTLGSKHDHETDVLREWKDAVVDSLAELYVFQEAAASISKRYFDGEQLLFPDAARILAYVLESMEKLVDTFNETFTGEGKQLESLKLENVRQGIGKAKEALISYLVDMAKADALDQLGDRQATVELVDRHL